MYYKVKVLAVAIHVPGCFFKEHPVHTAPENGRELLERLETKIK